MISAAQATRGREEKPKDERKEKESPGSPAREVAAVNVTGRLSRSLPGGRLED